MSSRWFMLPYQSEFPPFIKANKYCTTCRCDAVFTPHPWMDFWVVFTFWFLWTLVFEQIRVRVLLSVPCVYTQDWLDHMIILCLIIWGISYCFHRSCTIFHSHQQCIKVPISLHPQQYFTSCSFLFFFFKVIVILMTVQWYLTGILIFTTLMIGDVDDLSCTY